MVAYDYEAQRWIYGEAAVRLREAQFAEDRDLLNNPAYLAFIAKKSDARDEGRVLVCDFCGDEVANEGTACCGEVRNEWTCRVCREAGDGSVCQECLS